MISDIDEIPNPMLLKNLYNEQIYYFSHKNVSRVATIKAILKNSKNKLFYEVIANKFILNKIPISLEQDMFYYFLNGKQSRKWYGTILCKYKNMTTPQELRNQREILPFIKNGGWHFSYLGGVDRVIKKMLSIVEGNDNKATKDYLKNCLEKGLDIYGNVKINYIDKKEIGIDNIDNFIEKYPYLYKQ